ncbi:hypothetical protein SGUI_0802 [Serinicoccus hydrothermalis]|uniref:DUF6504 domain-containing protein n=1 Tax=Serinicoccus hydrothermalis TaxID=1758689 RepID=A0A1B1N9W2_9MICO|nr:DUF6504 family protein [Serinicoccus hydrothermalis]ANS78198.1 hypothetical protein SGUI_0802 [Serinicoccus hydrothermalis]
MSRSYHEPVEVRTGAADEHGVRLDGAVVLDPDGGSPPVPTVFLWRGRVHLVRAVLGRWTQRVPWWRSEDARTSANPANPADEEPAAARPELERVVWRVEAGAGRASGTGVYDLVQGGRWWLERVAD